jgi:hypothetical protein
VTKFSLLRVRYVSNLIVVSKKCFPYCKAAERVPNFSNISAPTDDIYADLTLRKSISILRDYSFNITFDVSGEGEDD